MAITFGAIAYHFGMRLAVGYIFDRCMNNKADYTHRWYQLRPMEIRLYQVIKVKKWKHKMPSYQPDLFSPKLHTWDEIAQAMCQAELVHETIVVLSFVPVCATVFWGAFYVFLATSVGAALLDLLFVVMQRYNRGRIISIAQKRKGSRI